MIKKDIKKVLVVDDEETLTWSMTKTLAKDKEKYELTIANTGEEALQILEKDSIDVVLTDIRMPDMNGLDLLSKVREKYPRTKVIIMTAYGSPEVQKEATKRGSYYYIEKPFEISEIRAFIIKAIEENRRGFIGQVVDLQLIDIIQMGCLGRLTMLLSVSKGDEEGLIYFKNGEIAHAEVGDLEGVEALYTMLNWKEGQFNSQMGVSAPKETIADRWEHLLMEGMRRRDEESLAKSQDSSVLLQEVEKAFEDLDKEVEVKEWLERVLKVLTNIYGFEKGMWFDDKGKMLVIDNQAFAERDTIVPLLMFNMAARMSGLLGASPPLRINLGYKSYQSIIMRYDHLFLMVLLRGRTTPDEFYSAARGILEKRLFKA